MRSSTITYLSKEVLMWILTLLVLVPVFLVLLNSFKPTVEANSMNFAWPSSFHLDNYVKVIQGSHLFRSFLNSMLISTSTVILTSLTSSMSAFVLSRNRTRLNKAIYYIVLLGLVAPMNMVATFKIMQLLHLLNTMPGIILLYSAMFMPFSVFLYYGFIHGVPRALDEAAIIDGCSGRQLFGKVILPLLKPVTSTVLIINFLTSWNDFVIPLYYLNSSTKWGMIMAMYNYYGSFYSQWNNMCVVIVLTIVPILIVYLLGQKYIIAGMTSGAVKG